MPEVTEDPVKVGWLTVPLAVTLCVCALPATVAVAEGVSEVTEEPVKVLDTEPAGV